MPEPILGETVTDIDGREAGEVEWELNGSDFRARRGGAYALDTSAEIEWLVTRHLGLRLEPTLSRDAVDGTSETGLGASGGASWKLVHDFVHDFHLQAEVLARLPWDGTGTPVIQPGDPAEPLAADLRAGLRFAPLTLRANVGVGAGSGEAAHVPLRAGLALLTLFEPTGRFGFWGLELDADGARSRPFVAALDVMPNLAPVGLPLHLGIALPLAIGERDDRPSLGIFVRVLFESQREVEFAEAK